MSLDMFDEYFPLCVCLCLCVSVHRICHTTREPYFGEENGIDYHFVTEEDFQSMIRMVRSLHITTLIFGIKGPRSVCVRRKVLICCSGS